MYRLYNVFPTLGGTPLAQPPSPLFLLIATLISTYATRTKIGKISPNVTLSFCVSSTKVRMVTTLT